MILQRIAVLSLVALAAQGEVIDRVAVVVGDQVITESAIRRQIRVNAMLRGEEPDYSPSNKKEAAENLIRQAFVRREIEITRYTPPAMAEAEKQWEENFGARGPEFQKRFEAAGFSERDLKELFLQIIAYTRFVDARFGAGVTVTDAEVREFYEKEYLPEALRQNPTQLPEPLEQSYTRVSRILEMRKANAALDLWLEQIRQQVPVKYFEEAFR
jgi:hypothetical protein